MIYLYDGTFDGFLTCVYEHYHSEKADCIFDEAQSARRATAFQPDMLIDERRILTDEVKANAVGDALRDKISPYVLARVYRVFRTSTENKEMLLLNYIRFSFKHGSSASFLRTHPLVLPVAKAEEKIGNEVHRLCGLVRFSSVRMGSGTVPAQDCEPTYDGIYAGEATTTASPATHTIPESSATTAISIAPLPPSGASGDSNTVHTAPSAIDDFTIAPSHITTEILYATIEPDHDVLEFLAPHFSDRFKCDPFIIHDTKRGRALIACNREWQIADFTREDAALIESTEGETAYRELWRRYYDTIGIKERTNPKLRRNFMPSRYWKYLPEMHPGRHV